RPQRRKEEKMRQTGLGHAHVELQCVAFLAERPMRRSTSHGELPVGELITNFFRRRQETLPSIVVVAGRAAVAGSTLFDESIRRVSVVGGRVKTSVEILSSRQSCGVGSQLKVPSVRKPLPGFENRDTQKSKHD